MERFMSTQPAILKVRWKEKKRKERNFFYMKVCGLFRRSNRCHLCRIFFSHRKFPRVKSTSVAKIHTITIINEELTLCNNNSFRGNSSHHFFQTFQNWSELPDNMDVYYMAHCGWECSNRFVCVVNFNEPHVFPSLNTAIIHHLIVQIYQKCTIYQITTVARRPFNRRTRAHWLLFVRSPFRQNNIYLC